MYVAEMKVRNMWIPKKDNTGKVKLVQVWRQDNLSWELREETNMEEIMRTIESDFENPIIAAG
jgi:hypothetical protein